ncbi:hypothetical protein BKA62DRAFT_710722 [Auriculariales sp. MPI-PUGE-AT-0066]|nr:hypothetical protein BKA62DRAFT_710722 [Auriculariales sp. MPI-PUGE-AT-0066]
MPGFRTLLVLSAAVSSTFAAFSPPTLNITALVGKDGASAFECWSLVPGFAGSTSQARLARSSWNSGNLSNASYSILPPNFDGGLHNAPAFQFVQFLSGVARIVLPTTNETAYIVGGERGLLFAADTHDVSDIGHITTYPTT